MGPKNYVRSDGRICEDVCERLTEADDIDARGITVKARSGEITLEGCVATLSSRCAAEHQALSCRGVTDVRNRLEVRSGHKTTR
ncbi:BON domain-containing protein [Rhodobacter sp. 24-YEA-8]|uniref:BON domain-containing protein n=1 Tax=Rhodobacter sp. 24-YEA-8 TaxID=1884310 RepID=UPI003451052A